MSNNNSNSPYSHLYNTNFSEKTNTNTNTNLNTQKIQQDPYFKNTALKNNQNFEPQQKNEKISNYPQNMNQNMNQSANQNFSQKYTQNFPTTNFSNSFSDNISKNEDEKIKQIYIQKVKSDKHLLPQEFRNSITPYHNFFAANAILLCFSNLYFILKNYPRRPDSKTSRMLFISNVGFVGLFFLVNNFLENQYEKSYEYLRRNNSPEQINYMIEDYHRVNTPNENI